MNKINLWDDATKYVISCGLFLIFMTEMDILFGLCSLIMLFYFIRYEYKYVIKYLTESQRYIYLRSIISTAILMIEINLEGNDIFVLLSFLNVCLIIISIVGPLIWNEKIYFDDKANNLKTLFTTKNGEYSRTIYVIQKLGLKLPFSKKYTSVTENISYLDKIAKEITNFDINTLEKFKLILSINGEKNSFKSILYNFIYFVVVVAITGKASIQMGDISGIEIKINTDLIISIILALVFFVALISPLIIRLYRNIQIIKDRNVLLIIIERAIQIEKQKKE